MKEPAFLDLINNVRNTSISDVLKSSASTQVKELQTLLEAMAFMDSGELYISPFNYKPFFGKYLNQAHKTEISSFAQSIALQQRKGRVLAKSFIGIYTFEELTDYIKLLNQLGENAQQDLALNLVSEHHDIALCYSHATQCWQLFDVNQPDLLPLSAGSPNWEEQLASQIRKAFCDNTRVLFQTEIWTTGLSASGVQTHIRTFSDDSKFKRLHDIASHAHLVNSRNVSLAYMAANCGDVEVLQGCIALKNKVDGRYSIDLNHVINRGATPLYIAIQNGFLEAVKILIAAKDEAGKKYRVNLNKSAESDVTPALVASYFGHTEILKCLIDAKDEDGTYRVDLNIPRKDSVTPVFMAARNGHVEAVKLLIEARNSDGTYRVDLNKSRAEGDTPVFVAVQNGHADVLERLIAAEDENGACRVDLNKAAVNGVTPVSLAVEKGDINALKLLIEAKDRNGRFLVDLNKPNNQGVTPIWIAAAEGRVEAVKLLIEARNSDGTYRVDLNQRGLNEATPIYIAAQYGYKDVVLELIKANADIHLGIQNTVENLKAHAQDYGPEIMNRVNTFTNKKKEVVIEPKDVARILGHNEIVCLFEKKELVDRIQERIKALKTHITSVEEMKIPSAYRMHDVLNKAVKEYRDKVYDCTPAQLQELNSSFKKSCQAVRRTIEEGGLGVEAHYGDAINNVLTAIINALNHLLSLPVKLLTWDSSYTLFHRKDYSSQEIRGLFGDLHKISLENETECLLAQDQACI